MKIRRSLTIKAEIWRDALTKANSEGFSLSAVITMLITKWLKRGK